MRTHKWCPRCQETKPVSEWGKNAGRYDKLQVWCKMCTRVSRRLTGEYGLQKAAYNKIYGESLPGSMRNVVRNFISDHPGMAREVAEEMMEKVFNLDSRCVICGLPEGQRTRMKLRGWGWVEGIGRRLSIDHIDPFTNDHSRGNLRILCVFCNRTRGAALWFDHQVLAKAHRHWGNKLPNRWLWWLTPLIYEKGGNDKVSCGS